MTVQKQTLLTLLLFQVDNLNVDGAKASLCEADDDLYKIAQVFRRVVQGGEDLVGRYGLITFAVVLPQQTEAEGEAVAEELLQQVQSLDLGSR